MTCISKEIKDGVLIKVKTGKKVITLSKQYWISEKIIHNWLKLGTEDRISMSKKASPWENAYQESFYYNFRTDLGLEFDRFIGVGELVEAISQTIHYYNQQRIHTSLKMSPAKYRLYQEQKVLEKVVEKMGT
ncbi:hypothetical protein A2313_02950 [Candidatus Roizmanbacteria bacterium RIFOXYB2_FULL_41_10]|nr:MAG: hypothetical protein A2262_03835 [Candidatus Roizmanbacteria bacterium RIFOXYA2_FULL_41_8]OGK66968.1 MAG: hypothetical protein A2377_03800 [Candidatus Roizmanbacteria bacterium RIFOXYB1_FULL_41_27]OGK71987.1 MAG: hypothetical protein A2403_03465 [Candidatus Roizmanbacteria bacterium RIFOXYC1_FULL_41_16]OGK72090.1 MAG: hypothetical protein A2313_02950 [Candidatus Roizmanbacteria bacterium RIFOXYB2_FULL_41_10]OGK75394.1 MAG: hypothetical protein A2575_02160 [Candidatus Roizmanbacteria bac